MLITTLTILSLRKRDRERERNRETEREIETVRKGQKEKDKEKETERKREKEKVKEKETERKKDGNNRKKRQKERDREKREKKETESRVLKAYNPQSWARDNVFLLRDKRPRITAIKTVFHIVRLSQQLTRVPSTLNHCPPLPLYPRDTAVDACAQHTEPLSLSPPISPGYSSWR